MSVVGERGRGRECPGLRPIASIILDVHRYIDHFSVATAATVDPGCCFGLT